MKILPVILTCMFLGTAAYAENVSTQQTPESARKFEKTEFEAVVTNIKLEKNQVTVAVDGVEYRLKAPRSNLATLKVRDKVKVYLRGNGEDKEAWKLVKK